ncbi:MAG: dihydroorotate dehydrogenase electron transfer subunit [Desulfocapsa sp.]|nr:MAG: dihydroorotate dehydrogenase electron transfer subunit [Desulfocapsa sp.]
MSQFQEKTAISRIERLTSDIFRLSLEAPGIASKAKPGQFVMIRTGNGKDPLLRRPFSISQTSSGKYFQILFKVVGCGTSILAHCREGEFLSVLGPLGSGFLFDCKDDNCLVGGGMGIAPLLFLAKSMLRSCTLKPPTIVLGARNKEELAPLIADFKELGLSVYAATDDGSLGQHGLVTDVLKELDLASSCQLFVCGPTPMMTAVHFFSKEKGVACQVSMETAMACGMGACLGCIVPLAEGGYAHACSDGPVFEAKELLWQIR